MKGRIQLCGLTKLKTRRRVEVKGDPGEVWCELISHKSCDKI